MDLRAHDPLGVVPEVERTANRTAPLQPVTASEAASGVAGFRKTKNRPRGSESTGEPDSIGRPRCYVASPLGFSEAGRHYHSTVLLPALTDLVDPVDPWALVSQDEVEAAVAQGRERQMAEMIGRRNHDALKGCQLLVGVLDGQEIDSGTAAEIGFAAAIGLVCFGLRTDYRQCGEPGATVNLQVEAFISLSGGRIASSIGELRSDLQAASLPEPRQAPDTAP